MYSQGIAYQIQALRMNTIIKAKLKFTGSELIRGILQSLLIAFLVLYLFIENEIIWSLYVFFLFLIAIIRKKLVISPSIIILLLLLPLIWGFIMSFDDQPINTAKGFFYLSVPLIMVMIGFQMAKIYDLKHFLILIRNAGNIISLIFIVFTIQRAGFNAFLSPYTEARFIVGSGSPVCVLSLILGFFSGKFGLDIYKNRYERWIAIILNLTAIYLFASRTYWVLLVLFILLFSLKTMKKENLLVILGLLLFIFSVISIWVNSQSDLSFANSLLFKLINSLNEIRIREFKTFEEINTYFRGYEAFRSWETYSNGNIFELIFGGGFGQLVDLKIEILLAGSYWKAVPWVHNGFFFILVKQGALGLVFIVSFFIFFINEGIKDLNYFSRDKHFRGIMLISITLSLFITNFVDCGLFNFEMSILLITLGFLISLKLK